MKHFLTVCFLILALSVQARTPDSAAVIQPKAQGQHRPTIVTLAVGMGDYYRSNPTYALPSGFAKNNTTGFPSIAGKLEYGINQDFCMAATVYHDNFNYNFSQAYTGNGVTFTRYRVNNFALFGVGLSGIYYIPMGGSLPNFSTFLCLGFSLNNIQQSQVPQGDSTTALLTHVVSPVLRVGGRYSFTKSRQAGLVLELGYDRQSYVSLGLSAQLVRKKGKHLRL